ncbi:hypothetical protein K7X08_015224 [Anisodus acutangulus]|uniref:Myb-like domain-containing protein n=1 Tax=Anisodus acutangulus TaxID=402998 RepID=A0A9Q1QUC2_9SOLA|nr:hypothetical protein K7X08_015224 [Anisodus acutangulus]
MYVHPRFHELMRQQPLQNNHVPSVFPTLEDVERRLNMINNNDVNYHNPPVFNFNVAHQVQQQGVNQQPNDVASTSRGKSPRVRWTDELHAMFVKAVQDWGGTWGEASFKKKQEKLLQQVEEQMLKVDGKKSTATHVYIPQLPTKAEIENMAALGTSLEDFLNYLPN